MKIKNYTTLINASKTIHEIEEMLAENRATHIMKEYRGDSRVFSLSFKIGDVGYKLPSDTEKVYQRLKEDRYIQDLTSIQKQKLEEQAERVAWRVIKDWLHAQLSLIYVGQAEIEQVMLPYAYDGQRTLYEKLKQEGMMGFLPAPEEVKK